MIFAHRLFLNNY